MSFGINRRTFTVVSAAALMATVAGSAFAQSGEYPRNETLYMSGAQWGNIVGFNPYFGNFANGLIGLVNETLFRYDPIADKYIDWLAEKGEWTSPENRMWRTDCDSAVTGRGGCRNYLLATTVSAVPAASGGWSFVQADAWVFNGIVRFS